MPEITDNNCLKCKGLGDCPYSEVALDGTPSPPIECPYFTERMKQVEKNKKRVKK